MEVFETSYLPLWMVTSLHGYKTSLLGGEFSLGSVALLLGWTGLPKRAWSSPTEGSHSPHRGWSPTSKLSMNMSHILLAPPRFVLTLSRN